MTIGTFGKKADGFVWFGVILALIGFGLLFIMLDQPMQEIHDVTVDNITGTQYETNYTRAFTIWDKILLIFFLILLLAGIMEILER
jgi:hypothetical protein